MTPAGAVAGVGWTSLLAAGVVRNGYTRVHQGAPHTLDAIGSVALGRAATTAVVGRPTLSRPA